MSTAAPETPGAPSGTEPTAPDAAGSTTTEPTVNGTGGQEPTAPGSTETAPPAATGQEPAEDGKAARTIAALRDEFKAERAKRQQAEKAFTEFRTASEQRETERQQAEAEQRKRLAIALGVAQEDEPPDPAKLAEQLERQTAEHQAALAARDAEIRQRDLRLAVLTQAPGLEANGALLMDSLSFLRKIGDLDPSAQDFTERLGEEIKSAVEANPNYKMAKAAPAPKPAPAVPRSGGEHNGAPGGNRQLNLQDIEGMTPAEVVKAQDAGLLVDLGFGPRKKRY